MRRWSASTAAWALQANRDWAAQHLKGCPYERRLCPAHRGKRPGGAGQRGGHHHDAPGQRGPGAERPSGHVHPPPWASLWHGLHPCGGGYRAVSLLCGEPISLGTCSTSCCARYLSTASRPWGGSQMDTLAVGEPTHAGGRADPVIGTWLYMRTACHRLQPQGLMMVARLAARPAGRWASAGPR